MIGCHSCSCHFNPPCSNCENCNCLDFPECENDCQECDIDHYGLTPKPRVFRDDITLEWLWACYCEKAPPIIWPTSTWAQSHQLAYLHSEVHHDR